MILLSESVDPNSLDRSQVSGMGEAGSKVDADVDFLDIPPQANCKTCSRRQTLSPGVV